MNIEDFRKSGKEMIDYICQYVTNMEQKDVAPKTQPGYLKNLLPDAPPIQGEKFEDIMNDFETSVMPGVMHWCHPKFFGHFPSANSFPSILGDMLSSAIGSIGFSWASCPAATELESIVLDWYARALDLPPEFISDTPSSCGGGALQGSASECTLVCMLAARARVIKKLKASSTEIHDSVFLPQLIAYASEEAHSSVEKAAGMALVKLRIIETDENGRMRADLLQQTIQNDANAGLTPFFVVATMGTTNACAFDNLSDIGKACKQVSTIWYHIDGAYAGNALILPEMRTLGKGLEFADSFIANPSKLLLTNFDASAMWVRDVMCLKTTFNVDPLYLQHSHDKAIDYRHYGIPLSRRFRALKLWFVFRTYGIKGLQSHIRNHMNLAKKFESLLHNDTRFEVCNDVCLGLVCFRMRAGEQYTKDLLERINTTRKMYMTPALVGAKYTIRFCVTYEHATERHIVEAWQQVKRHASLLAKKFESRQEFLPVLPKQPRMVAIPYSRSPSLYAQLIFSFFLCAATNADLNPQ